jgi:RNA polymerase subunit RPABC4/transcription elongation factor Spt4
MNTALLKALKEIVSRYGGVDTLSDARRVRALLADLAAGEPRPRKNALIACLEGGFAGMLQNVPPGERKAAKAVLAERLNREELLEAALFGAGETEAGTARSGGAVCPACGTALPEGARFCPVCGAAASDTAKPSRKASPRPQRDEEFEEADCKEGPGETEAAPAVTPKFCGQCGASLTAGAKFCGSCGAKAG